MTRQPSLELHDHISAREPKGATRAKSREAPPRGTDGEKTRATATAAQSPSSTSLIGGALPSGTGRSYIAAAAARRLALERRTDEVGRTDA